MNVGELKDGPHWSLVLRLLFVWAGNSVLTGVSGGLSWSWNLERGPCDWYAGCVYLGQEERKEVCDEAEPLGVADFLHCVDVQAGC